MNIKSFEYEIRYSCFALRTPTRSHENRILTFQAQRTLEIGLTPEGSSVIRSLWISLVQEVSIWQELSLHS